MHHALLLESQRRAAPLPVDNIRFIANAAGGLLPVLAEGLRDTFRATILTSYGMTEWYGCAQHDSIMILNRLSLVQYAYFYSSAKLSIGSNGNIRNSCRTAGDGSYSSI
jgi:hypothetical protein